jgi:hypothetical protein
MYGLWGHQYTLHKLAFNTVPVNAELAAEEIGCA